MRIPPPTLFPRRPRPAWLVLSNLPPVVKRGDREVVLLTILMPSHSALGESVDDSLLLFLTDHVPLSALTGRLINTGSSDGYGGNRSQCFSVLVLGSRDPARACRAGLLGSSALLHPALPQELLLTALENSSRWLRLAITVCGVSD
jgi:hypothetical protein